MNTTTRLITTIAGAVVGGAAMLAFQQRKRRRQNSALADGDKVAEAPHDAEVVQLTSEDSFPASDPPAWTGATGNAAL